MKTAKITEILQARKWEGKYGDVYYIPLKLDNGEQITLGKKKEDAFKIGDVVNYEDYTDDKGNTKQREVKENPFTKKNFNSDSNKGAMVGMALKIAFECFYDKKQENFKETIALAHRIVEEAENMLGEENKEESEDSQLPF